MRKVRLRKCVFRKQTFFPPDPSPNIFHKAMDDAAAMKLRSELLIINDEEGKANQTSSSTSKVDRDLQWISETVHYFTQVADHVWEDHKAPTSRGDQRLNYLRMAYMARKMLKQSKRPKRF